MRHFINTFIYCVLFCGSIGFAYCASPSAEEQITLQYPNNPVGDVLAIYEKLTGKVLVRDANLAGPNLNIVANESMPKSEAIRLIEAALLLNGYSLVPDGDNHVKVINATAGKSPRSEGVPLYANPSAIPQDNQVISYFMQFRFLASRRPVPSIGRERMITRVAAAQIPRYETRIFKDERGCHHFSQSCDKMTGVVSFVLNVSQCRASLSRGF